MVMPVIDTYDGGRLPYSPQRGKSLTVKSFKKWIFDITSLVQGL
jgi:hypothetical protein